MIDQLENPAILLMYLAEELPTDERAEVERHLAADPSLRRQLEDLRAVQASFHAEMAALDASQPLIGEKSSVNRITRAMRQHQVRPALVDYKPAAVQRNFWHRVPRWAYPLTAAAALALAYVGWWTLKPVDPRAIAFQGKATVIEPVISNDSEDAVVEGLENNLRDANRTQSKDFRQLRMMEQQVADLSQSSSDPLQGLLSDHPVISDE